MDCDVYVTLPRGFNADPSTSAQPSSCSQRNSRPVMHKLLKGVPGIPQGSHLFNKKLHAVLTALDYERLADDCACCIYKLKGQPIFLAVWVDDLLLAYYRPGLPPTCQRGSLRFRRAQGRFQDAHVHTG
jgi:hypothetical protein